MVLQQRGFLGAEGGGDILAFFFGEDDAVELAVDDVVLNNINIWLPKSNKREKARRTL